MTSYWAVPPIDTARGLGTGLDGLSAASAASRLALLGPNELVRHGLPTRWLVIWRQVRNPLLLLLVFAAAVSALTGGWLDAAIVLTIVVVSTVIGYRREYAAQTALLKLRERIHVRSTVVRDGRPVSVPSRELVPGDLVLLSAGSLAPADGVIVEANDCFVNQAVLTGESFPIDKHAGEVAAAAPLAERSNCVFVGSNVHSGTARVLIVATGRGTEFSAIAERLSRRAPETAFERSLKHFGYLMTTTMVVVVLTVFAANMLLGRPVIDTLLFAIALAVGLSPELLPAILSVNLARGARMMADRGVMVRRLSAIENLGSIDVLCTDKTGTLTEGIVQLDGAYDLAGARSPHVLELAATNAALQTGLANPLDDAIGRAHRPDLAGVTKLGEIPYDFARKRLSVVVRDATGARLVTKGAFASVLDACAIEPVTRADAERRYDEWTAAGTRVLAVATRTIADRSVSGPSYGRDDERDLELAGFLTFLDRPKEGAAEAIVELRELGVAIKMISGDSKRVAQHVARAVGLDAERVITGAELDLLHGPAMLHAVDRTDLFVEVDPRQKERVIAAFRQVGHVVGFLGDGVNDAPAMHVADTSISVEGAVDVAREAADFVLLDRHLSVIRDGVLEGRRTYANTLKYINTTTSANLGNMLSMAVASFVLPFLPLLAGQILLNNFLSDVPAIGIADDSVDPELVARPQRWEIRSIARFMIMFGVLSSVFDLATFAILLGPFGAGEVSFRSGWFVESLLTELLIALVVRTRRPFWKSRPGTVLLVTTLALVPLTLAIPYLPYAGLLGFGPVPASLLLAIVAITMMYFASAELLKARMSRAVDRPARSALAPLRASSGEQSWPSRAA
ncbi:MAG: magnesium-translocating P-type ATPase [Deltaproteobacteria bacterium]|nr:magnesium-translocating P-type ATPase [Deltaproteobacteria bacterium]